MAELRIDRRAFVIGGAAAGSAWLLAACTSGKGSSTSTSSPARVSTEPRTIGRYQVGKLEEATIVTDPAQIPKTFQEAPDLQALVKAGRLPPVAQRIGPAPVVIKPVHEVGHYSQKDVLRRGITGPDLNNVERFAAGPTGLVAENDFGATTVPLLAMRYEENPDRTGFTLHLRPGMKWSDGQPFTADDIMFWWEDVYKDEAVGAYPDSYLQVHGKDITVEKVDDRTVRFTAPEPSYTFGPGILASYDQSAGRDGLSLYLPKHYLQQFHPKYVGKAKANQLAKAAGFTDWASHLLDRADWLVNPDLPVVSPWRIVKGRDLNSQHLQLERNPYSIWVDTAGNQLPYIGTLTFADVGDAEGLNLSAIAGQYDFQDRGLDMLKLPLLLENQSRGHYKIHLDPSEEVDWGVRLNLSYDKDREIGDLLRTADFRRALSLGIDYDQFNETFFLGTGTPSAAVPGPDNKYYPGDQYATRWATHDVQQANALLDRVGLRLGPDGLRRRRDGKGPVRLRYEEGPIANTGEVLRRNWREIGIDLLIDKSAGNLIVSRALANEIQLFGHILFVSDIFNYTNTAFPSDNYSIQSANGILYANWFLSGGKEGKEPFPELKELMRLWQQGYDAAPDQRVRIGKQWWQRSADLCLQLGGIARTVSVWGIHLARDNLGNVPERVLNSNDSSPMLNAWPLQFYYR